MEFSNHEESERLQYYEDMTMLHTKTKSDHEVGDDSDSPAYMHTYIPTSESDSDIDSDMENFLYGQAHYSAELQFAAGRQKEVSTETSTSVVDVESKKSEAEFTDIQFPELLNDISFTCFENIDYTGSPKKIGNTESPKNIDNTGSPKNDDVTVPLENWDINDSDAKGKQYVKASFRSKPRYYIENEMPNVHCYNCDRRGHMSRDCYKPKKEACCYLCGGKGHMRWKCPNYFCHNCQEIGHNAKGCTQSKSKNKGHKGRCRRCSIRGHNKDGCPEIWRQYHLTVDDGQIKQPSRKEKKMQKIRNREDSSCYNCGHKGHFGHECNGHRQFRRHFHSPFVVHYDQCPFVAVQTEASLNDVTNDAKYGNSAKEKENKEREKTDQIDESVEEIAKSKEEKKSKIVKLNRKKERINNELQQSEEVKADNDAVNDKILNTLPRNKDRHKKRSKDTIFEDVIDLTVAHSDHSGGKRKEKFKKLMDSYVTISDSDQSDVKRKEKNKKPVDSYVTISDSDQTDVKRKDKIKKPVVSYVTVLDSDQNDVKRKEKNKKPVDSYVTISDSDDYDSDNEWITLDEDANIVSINVTNEKDYEETPLPNSDVPKDIKGTEDISRMTISIDNSSDKRAAAIGNRTVKNLQLTSDLELSDADDLRTSINKMKSVRTMNQNGEVTFENDRENTQGVVEEADEQALPQFITLDETGAFEETDSTRYKPSELREEDLSYYGLSLEALTSKTKTPRHVFFNHSDGDIAGNGDGSFTSSNGNVYFSNAFGNMPKNRWRKRKRQSTDSTDPNGKRQRTNPPITISGRKVLTPEKQLYYKERRQWKNQKRKNEEAAKKESMKTNAEKINNKFESDCNRDSTSNDRITKNKKSKIKKKHKKQKQNKETKDPYHWVHGKQENSFECGRQQSEQKESFDRGFRLSDTVKQTPFSNYYTPIVQSMYRRA